MGGSPLPQIDAMDCAVLVAQIERGPETLLERDRQALARGCASLLAGRERSASYVLALACRRTCLFRGPEEAIARLDAAADEAGVARESALRAALHGALKATTPKL
jgi:hypothetical protein